MKLILFIIFILSSPAYAQSAIANGCTNQILDKTAKLSTNEVDQIKSEIYTWESIFSSVISSCLSATFRHGGCKTRFLLYARDSMDISNYVRDTLWLLGHCNDSSMLIYFSGKQECDTFQLDSNNTSNFSQPSIKPESKIVVNFMSHMLQIFFSSVVRNDHANIKWNYFSWPCEIVAGKLAARNKETTKDDKMSFTSSPAKAVSLNNASEHDLTKHHGHGGITDAVLTIICAICGSTALSFLLFFRRIRHCICSICGLCRDTERLLSDY